MFNGSKHSLRRMLGGAGLALIGLGLVTGLMIAAPENVRVASEMIGRAFGATEAQAKDQQTKEEASEAVGREFPYPGDE